MLKSSKEIVSPTASHAHLGNAFDLIRFMAALGVLYSHSFPLTGRPEPTYIGGETLGSLCVFIFFATSGYLVKTSWDRSKNPFSFALNRGLRIYPALVVCLLICAFLLGPIVSSTSTIGYLTDSVPYRFVFSNLAMFFTAGDNHLPGVFEALPLPKAVNGSLWTIRYEVFMYIILLLLVMIFSKSSQMIGAALIAFVGLWGVGTYMGLSDPGQLLWRLNSIGLDGAILKLAPFFLIGALLARAPQTALKPSFAVSGIALLFLFYVSPFAILALWLVLPYCVLVFAYHAPKLFNRFGRFGDFSYGIYLYAFPVQQTLSLFQVKDWLTHLLSSFFITLTFAILSWKLIESPALKLKSRIRSKLARAGTSY